MVWAGLLIKTTSPFPAIAVVTIPTFVAMRYSLFDNRQPPL